ncbi:hypothetical protein, partial [Enterococcus faecium]|uniref:hypothetical protein n=1 Tax=Enterococcus faecium TaxID=1352 RepID=UPI0034E93FA8
TLPDHVDEPRQVAASLATEIDAAEATDVGEAGTAISLAASGKPARPGKTQTLHMTVELSKLGTSTQQRPLQTAEAVPANRKAKHAAATSKAKPA